MRGKMKTPARRGKAKSASSSTIPAKITFDRTAVCRFLGIDIADKLEFGGKEWLQDFDEDAVLIATVKR